MSDKVENTLGIDQTLIDILRDNNMFDTYRWSFERINMVQKEFKAGKKDPFSTLEDITNTADEIWMALNRQSYKQAEETIAKQFECMILPMGLTKAFTFQQQTPVASLPPTDSLVCVASDFYTGAGFSSFELRRGDVLRNALGKMVHSLKETDEDIIQLLFGQDALPLEHMIDPAKLPDYARYTAENAIRSFIIMTQDFGLEFPDSISLHLSGFTSWNDERLVDERLSIDILNKMLELGDRYGCYIDVNTDHLYQNTVFMYPSGFDDIHAYQFPDSY